MIEETREVGEVRERGEGEVLETSTRSVSPDLSSEGLDSQRDQHWRRGERNEGD